MKSRLLLFTLIVTALSWAQSADYQFENKWVSSQNRCVPCDYNEATGEVLSTSNSKVEF